MNDDSALTTVFVDRKATKRRLRKSRLVVEEGPEKGTRLDIASERGVNCAPLLAKLGIDQAAVERGEPVSMDQYGRLYQGVSQRLSQEWFGMLSGGAVPRGPPPGPH